MECSLAAFVDSYAKMLCAFKSAVVFSFLVFSRVL